MNKEELLRLAAQARHRAEGEDHDIVAQQKIIAALERKGLDSAKAREVLEWSAFWTNWTIHRSDRRSS